MPIFPVEAVKSLIENLEALIQELEDKLDAWPAERGTDNAELEVAAAIRYEALAALVLAIGELLDAWPAERGTDGAELEADADKRAIALALLIAGVEAKVDDVEVKLDTPANFMADVSGLATAAKLEDAMQKATGPDYDQDTDSQEAIREAIDTISVLAPAYGDIKVYPWAADEVLNADPDYTYTAVVSEGGTSYVEVGHFDFDEDTADIKGIFVNLVWGQKVVGAGHGLVKWQIASGSNASPGAYADITDEVSENLDTYSDHGRSGIVHKITGVPSQMPFTIRCVVKNVDANSAQAKIKSNSYIRVAYKRVS